MGPGRQNRIDQKSPEVNSNDIRKGQNEQNILKATVKQVIGVDQSCSGNQRAKKREVEESRCRVLSKIVLLLLFASGKGKKSKNQIIQDFRKSYTINDHVIYYLYV